MTGGDDRHLGDALSGLLDGELSPAEEAAARRHLGSCSFCALEMDEISTARAWVRDLPSVDPPFGFFERILREPAAAVARPAHRRRATRRRARVAAVAGSAAAAAVVLLGVAPPREAPVSPSVSSLIEAHATGASVNGDPLSRLAPMGIPLTFRR